MKQLLKTTLVAAAIAATCGSAVAGDLTVAATQVYSSQGLTALASTATVTSSNVTYTVNAAYAVGDLITVTLPVGSLPTGYTWPSTLGFTPSANLANMSIGLLSNTDNTGTYRVTTVSTTASGQTTTGGVINLGSFTLKASAIAAGAITVEVSTKASNGVTDIDSASSAGQSRSGTLASAKDQFGDLVVATKFDQTIDVSKMRKAFASGSNDMLSWTASNDTTLAQAATVSKTTLVLHGDFAGLANANFSTGKSSTIAYDDSKKMVTVTYNTSVTNDTLTVTPITGTSAVVLNAQKFNVDSTLNYGTNSIETLGTAVDAGEWKLNGSVVNIPYMPYSANASQIMYVSNSGTQSGDIIVTAFDDAGKSYELGTVGTSAGGKITKISKLVGDKLAEHGFTGGKVSITVTVNAPADDITVYASYNVGGSDRGFVNTSQYKGK